MILRPVLKKMFIVIFCRSELTKKAEKESIEVFATNLKNLLLAPPVKGKCILGVDPGFKNGCKTSVITATGFIFKMFYIKK